MAPAGRKSAFYGECAGEGGPMPTGLPMFYCYVGHTCTYTGMAPHRDGTTQGWHHSDYSDFAWGRSEYFINLVKRHWHGAHWSHINQAHYTRCLSIHAPWKMSHFSTSLSSPDSSVVPCGALFLCLSQSTLLDLTILSLFITSSFYLSFSDKVHMLSKGVRNSSVF